jgi:hypothetical protein
MLKCNYKQGFGLTKEDGTPIKEFNVQLYMNAEGIDQRRIMEMFEVISKGFTSLIAGTTFTGDDDVQFSELDNSFNSSETNREGWI